MDLKKLKVTYNEFTLIQNYLSQNQSIEHSYNEDLIEINFLLTKGFTYNDLNFFYLSLKSFELYCNPFSDPLIDILHDIQSGSINFQDIDSIALRLPKHEKLLYSMDNQVVFFDINSCLNCFNEYIVTKTNKLTAWLPLIENIETPLVNYISFLEFDESILGKTLPQKLDDSSYKLAENYKIIMRNKSLTYNNPYSFIVENNVINSDIVLLDRKLYLFFLKLISEDAGESYLISGDRQIRLQKQIKFNVVNTSIIIKLLDFINSKEKFTEKYIIIKRVISISLTDNDDLNKFDEQLEGIWKTVELYYHHYIEDNLNDFFEMKDKLLKEATNVTKMIYEQTDKVNTSIVASLLSLIVIMITTIFRNLENPNTILLIGILIAFSFFSLFFYDLQETTSTNRYNIALSQFEYLVTLIPLMKNEEKQEIKIRYIEKPFEALNNTLLYFKNSLIILNLLSLIVVFYIIFEEIM